MELTVELASDFADILSIKHHDFALGDPGLAEALPPPVALSAGATPQMACLLDPEGVLSTEVRSSRAALVSGSALAFALALGPHAEWDVRLTFRPVTGRARPGRTPRARHFGEQRARIQRSLSAWNMRVPQLRASWPELDQAYASLGLGPRGPAHARQRRRGPVARCGHAVVHGGLRPRHRDHVPADARLRARARAHRAARAGRAAG